MTRIFRALRVEVALAASGCVTAALVAAHPARSIAVLALTAAAAVAGAVASWKRGRLAFAARCPRLDRSGLRVDGTRAPWATLRAAEAVLAAFEADGGRWREYFAEGRRDVLASASRAVELHRIHGRALVALVGAPPGQARNTLESQANSAAAEIHALTESLQQLKARLTASTAAVNAPAPRLESVAVRAHALSESLHDVSRAPARVGEHS